MKTLETLTIFHPGYRIYMISLTYSMPIYIYSVPIPVIMVNFPMQTLLFEEPMQVVTPPLCINT